MGIMRIDAQISGGEMHHLNRQHHNMWRHLVVHHLGVAGPTVDPRTAHRRPTALQGTLASDTMVPPPPTEFASCYHCGSVKHFHRDCRATNKTRNAYKTYQRFLKEESNYAQNEVMEANACHVDPPKAQPQTLDAPDFD